MTAIAVVLLWAAYLAREVLLLVYVSGLLAIGFSPIVRMIERQKLLPIGTRVPRWVAILALYVAILGTVALVLVLVLPPLIQQARSLWADLPEMFDRGQAWLINRGWLKEHLTLSEAVARAPGNSGDAVGKVAVAVASVAGGIIGVVTILILTFYLLIDAAHLRASLIRLFPRRHRARVDEMSREVTLKVSAWLGGQLLLAAAIAMSSSIGFWALGVPYFYVLAVIAGIGELIPMVGPILSAIPAIAVASSVSLDKALFVLIFCIVQQQLENHVLVPKIMSRQLGVSPATVIISLLIGGSLMGIVGAILAVPTAAIVQVIAGQLWNETEAGER